MVGGVFFLFNELLGLYEQNELLLMGVHLFQSLGV